MRRLPKLAVLGFFVLSVFISGCEACKGAGKGFVQDVKNICGTDGKKNAFVRADEWFRENLW